MADSIPSTVDGPRDGEVKMTSFAEAAVAALCCSLKSIDMDSVKFKTLMPLLITALSQCPSNSLNLLLDLLNGIYDLFDAVRSVEIIHSQSQISKIMDPLMETLPVHHPLFCSFLSSFDRFCQLLTGDATSLKHSLIKMCIRALRFPLNDDGKEESERLKKAKSDAWNFVSKWILFPSFFEPNTTELSDVIVELIEGEKEVEKLKEYVGVLNNLLDIVKRDETMTEPRRIWSKIWKILNQLIEEDRDRQLTTLCMKEVGICIPIIEMEILGETELNEIGLMMKKVLERETRRRENEPQIEHNNRTEESGGLLNRFVNIPLRLFQKEVPICNILYPIMPIVFILIEKCSNKYWGLRFVCILTTYAPEFALEFRDQIVPLLFHSLTNNDPIIRHIAANSFGQMAVSDVVELKEIAVHSLDFVCQLMYREDARLEGHIVATEDAVAAVIKIIGNCDEKGIGQGRMNEILVRFLSFFPLTGESKECDVAYSFLLDLIDSNNPLIMGEPNTNSPRLLYILTKAIHDDVFGEEDDSRDLKERTKNMIKQMANSSDSLNEWILRSGLNGDEQETLRRILTSTN